MKASAWIVLGAGVVAAGGFGLLSSGLLADAAAPKSRPQEKTTERAAPASRQEDDASEMRKELKVLRLKAVDRMDVATLKKELAAARENDQEESAKAELRELRERLDQFAKRCRETTAGKRAQRALGVLDSEPVSEENVSTSPVQTDATLPIKLQ